VSNPVNIIKTLAAVAALVVSTSAFAADYAPAPYYPPRPYVHRAPRISYYAPPPPAIRQAPPVYWVMAPPQYIQHLVPVRGCGGCSAGYAPVGSWNQMPPPAPWDRIYSDYGY
jgi:hypothetical protein